MVVENVKAYLKEVKVTKKGINISFENVKLRGEDLNQLAALLGEEVLLNLDVPQMDLFEDGYEDEEEEEHITYVEAPQDSKELEPEEEAEEVQADSSELHPEQYEMGEEDVMKELEL